MNFDNFYNTSKQLKAEKSKKKKYLKKENFNYYFRNKKFSILYKYKITLNIFFQYRRHNLTYLFKHQKQNLQHFID